MQGTPVQSLVWEEPTCHRTAEPVRHNHWSMLWSPQAATTEARMPGACASKQEKPLQWEAGALPWRVVPACHKLEKACMQQRRPTIAKNQNK